MGDISSIAVMQVDLCRHHYSLPGSVDISITQFRLLHVRCLAAYNYNGLFNVCTFGLQFGRTNSWLYFLMFLQNFG